MNACSQNFFQSLAWAPCMCWGSASTPSQAVDNSALAFTFCFQRASRSTAGENLSPSQVFSDHAHSLEHARGLDSQSVLFLSLSSQAFWLICCLPSFFLLPQEAVAKILDSSNHFPKMPPGKSF